MRRPSRPTGRSGLHTDHQQCGFPLPVAPTPREHDTLPFNRATFPMPPLDAPRQTPGLLRVLLGAWCTVSIIELLYVAQLVAYHASHRIP